MEAQQHNSAKQHKWFSVGGEPSPSEVTEAQVYFAAHIWLVKF